MECVTAGTAHRIFRQATLNKHVYLTLSPSMCRVLIMPVFQEQIADMMLVSCGPCTSSSSDIASLFFFFFFPSGAKQTAENLISSLSMVLLVHLTCSLLGMDRQASEMHQLTICMTICPSALVFCQTLERGRTNMCHLRHHQLEVHSPPHLLSP